MGEEKPEYKSAWGFSNTQAALYGKRLSELVEERGFITPKIVVEDAKRENSPYHNYFDWDDTEAAEKWRLMQANNLIRSISVTVVSENRPTIRQFFSVRSEGLNTPEPRVYVPLKAVMADKNKRQEIIEYALNELDSWTGRYAQYQELFGVVKAIKKAKKGVKPK